MLGKAQAMPEAVHILCSLGLMRVCAFDYYFLGIAYLGGVQVFGTGYRSRSDFGSFRRL